ncbi:unnamed protein product [Caenorhabditis bovis]|uniref:Uncharacterized protein n=1 Tax=Caenorhabditis bovis TaxID=2654633 RepID=A0A8S1F0F7_9PELO|nr:unnamed protein product [Caenorhabditis bovis]
MISSTGRGFVNLDGSNGTSSRRNPFVAVKTGGSPPLISTPISSRVRGEKLVNYMEGSPPSSSASLPPTP